MWVRVPCPPQIETFCSERTEVSRAERVVGQSLRDWSKKVRATFIISPPIYNFGILGRDCLGATRGARGQSGFCSKKVRISSRQYRTFGIWNIAQWDIGMYLHDKEKTEH